MHTIIDRNWEFKRTDESENTSWRNLNLPHDWAIEGEFSETNYIPAVREELHLEYRHDSFLPRGKGVYRKQLAIEQLYPGQRVILEFDGVFGESILFIDGVEAGRNNSGYTGAWYDITRLAAGKKQISIEMQVSAERMQGWWYEGAGIYRHVHLHILPACAFEMWGIAISTPNVTCDAAEIEVAAEILNTSSQTAACQVELELRSPEGICVGKTNCSCDIPPQSKEQKMLALNITKPHLWDVDDPALYTAVLTLNSLLGSQTETIQTGLRFFEFTPDRGFFLNGRHLQLRGGNLHHDFGGLGTALPDRAHEKNVEVFKDMGANIIRSAHNPAAPALMDACDKLGMLFWAETRNLHPANGAEKDLESLIRRDRNHPSLIIWSLANTAGATDGKRYLTDELQILHNLAKKLDHARPTAVCLEGNACANANAFALVTDVVGYNGGGCGITDRDHRLYPDRCIVVSEYASGRGARGIYNRSTANDEDTEILGDGRVMVRNGAYGTELDLINTHNKEWEYVQLRPYIAGGMMWSGIEYWGETCGYPVVTSQFGVLDICRFPKDVFYYYKKMWSKDVVMHIYPPWHHPGKEGKNVDVNCFTNCDSVELYFNGEKIPGIPDFLQKGTCYPFLFWSLPYQQGELVAVGKINGVEVCRQVMHNPEKPAGVRITADRPRLQADGDDIAFLRIDVIDRKGTFVPDAALEITVDVQGCGSLAGICSGDPASHEKESARTVKTFSGSALAIIRSSMECGEIKVTVSGNGLETQEIILTTSR